MSRIMRELIEEARKAREAAKKAKEKKPKEPAAPHETPSIWEYYKNHKPDTGSDPEGV